MADKKKLSKRQRKSKVRVKKLLAESGENLPNPLRDKGQHVRFGYQLGSAKERGHISKEADDRIRRRSGSTILGNMAIRSAESAGRAQARKDRAKKQSAKSAATREKLTKMRKRAKK